MIKMKATRLLVCFILLFVELCFPEPLYSQKLQRIKQLPVRESKSAGNSDYYIILLTGNGGRQHLVQSVTSYLKLMNISVLTINTKLYLLSEKRPAQIACDLENLMDSYTKKWGQQKIIFIGYSMGAEVLPFAINCMKKNYNDKIADLILIGPGQKVTFKIKLRDYYLNVNKGVDLFPEIVKMKKGYVICDDNEFSICRLGLDGIIEYDFLGGGHHFGGDYLALSRLIGKRLNLK